MTQQEIFNLLLLLSPIILIQLALAIYALFDLAKRNQVRGPRWLWAAALILTCLAIPTGIIVSALYLIWARNPQSKDDDTYNTD